MVGGLRLTGDVARLQALFYTEDDVVGDLGFESGDFDDSETAKGGTDDVGRKTEVCIPHSVKDLQD